MYELGPRKEAIGKRVKSLKDLRVGFGKPTSMPYVGTKEVVICGVVGYNDEELLVCETLEDMQTLFTKYAQGWYTSIDWYSGELIPQETSNPEEMLRQMGLIINGHDSTLPYIVKQAIVDYAKGVPGTAAILAVLSTGFTTREELEQFVGWPASRSTPERSGELWVRFVPYLELPEQYGEVGSIINSCAPATRRQVKEAIAAYAAGDEIIARELAFVCQKFKAASEVEDWVGWPVAKHTTRRVHQLRKRLNKG